jgi:GNAT superfamily N-acetyltransferase
MENKAKINLNTKLTDFSSSTLVQANRANLYEFFRHFENSTVIEYNKGPGFVRWSSRFPIDWYNGILCERDAISSDGNFIEENLAYFRAKNASEITFWLEDGKKLASWDSLLTQHGFKFEKGPPAMSMDLNKLNETYQLPDGVKIKIVSDEESMRERAEVILRGYGLPIVWKDDVADFYFNLGCDTPFRCYLAYWEGKPVSTAEIFFGKEVAGINGVTTVPEARGKGFASLTTTVPLLEARKMGYKVGTLQATKMGFPIYQRMGFEHNFNLSYFTCALST